MRTDDLLRRYLEQRREMGERELVLDTLAVADVMRILGVRPPAVVPESAPAVPAREARGAATPTDWRDALRAAGAPEGPAARVPASPSPAGPGSAEPLDAPASAALEVGGGEQELFAGPIAHCATLAEIADAVRTCTRCALYRTATHPVPGEGNVRARLMCVGEAPGQQEDETGRPFVGQAGQLLTKILAAIKLSREEVFIANVLKHRPPGNRNPHPDEVEACTPFLVRQIELIRPAVIVALGTFAAQTLLDTRLSIGKLRGTVHHYHGIPVVVTYHPAALLRNPAWKRPTWDDVQLARRILDSAAT